MLNINYFIALLHIPFIAGKFTISDSMFYALGTHQVLHNDVEYAQVLQAAIWSFIN
jgi:hypothetical protein